MPHKSTNDLKQVAYQFIRNRIISGEYKPGDMISEKDLQLEIGVSRTPIREALFKLENDYFINIYPRRGIFVSNITAKTIKDVYQLRCFIETGALEIVIDSLSKEWLLEMKNMFENPPTSLITKEEIKKYYVNLDWELHFTIIKQCRNIVLNDIMENIWSHNQRMRILTYDIEDRHDISTREHIQLIDYLIASDLVAAKEELLNHLNNSKEVALKYIELY